MPHNRRKLFSGSDQEKNSETDEVIVQRTYAV
jgi:hypothetical protein